MKVHKGPIGDEGALPLVVEARGATSIPQLLEWLQSEADWLERQLQRVGAVLLRRFPVFDDDDFHLVASAMLPKLLPYMEGQSPRTRLRDGVYTSTEYPQRLEITLHSELSYAANPPRQLLFGCQVPPQTGGETPIVDCRQAYAGLDASVREKFESKGIRYVKNMPGNAKGLGKSWQQHFETSDRDAVEDYLKQNDVEFRWLEDGGLWTAQHRPAVRSHPATAEICWHNQASLWHVSNHPERTQAQLLKYFGEDKLPTHAYFGDGTEIPLDELDHVRSVLWETSSSFAWERGDVLLVDNYLVAHGRKPFKGPRKIVVAMG